MSIPAAVLLKGGLGLGVLGAGATGVYYLSNKAPIATQEEPVLESKYDKALLAFLNKADGNNDIVFEVKKVTTTDGTESEASLTSDSPLTFTTAPVKIRAKVTVTNSDNDQTSEQLKTTGSKATNLGDIANLDIKAWTWTCDVEFTKGEVASNNDLKEDYKNRIWKENNQGLFGILTKGINGHSDPTDTNANNTKWTKEGIREVKKGFISQCAKVRGSNKNKDINTKTALETDDLKVKAATFALQNGTANEDSGKLVPANETTFNEWFKPEYGTKTYS